MRYFTLDFLNFQIFQHIILYWIITNHGILRPNVIEKGMVAIASGTIFLGLSYYYGVGVEVSSTDLFNQGRVSVYGDNENMIAIRICIALIILYFTISKNNLNVKYSRYVFIFFFPILFYLMISTGSRVAFIAMVLCVITLLLLLQVGIIKKTIYSILVFSLISVYIFPILLQSETLFIRLIQAYSDYDLSSRDVIWSQLSPIIGDNLILGVGRTGYSLKMGNVSPHNVVLEILCYCGLVGLTVFGTFFSFIHLYALKLYRKESLIMPIILLIPVWGMVLSGQILDKKLIWVVFAYITSQFISTNRNKFLNINI